VAPPPLYAAAVESSQLLGLLLWYPVLLFSLTFHEAAHAWAARRGGDSTAYLGGQVSLDPRPHIRREPFGTVFAPLLSFAWGGFMIGWASTPYDPRWAMAHPRRAAWMALAGPAANALLLLAVAVAIRAGVGAGVFEGSEGYGAIVSSVQGGFWDTLARLLSIAFLLNLLLLVFNLIPLPPLDGSGAVALVLPEAWALRLRQVFQNPSFAFGGILVAWLAIREIFPPVLRGAVQLLYAF